MALCWCLPVCLRAVTIIGHVCQIWTVVFSRLCILVLLNLIIWQLGITLIFCGQHLQNFLVITKVLRMWTFIWHNINTFWQGYLPPFMWLIDLVERLHWFFNSHYLLLLYFYFFSMQKSKNSIWNFYYEAIIICLTLIRYYFSVVYCWLSHCFWQGV